MRSKSAMEKCKIGCHGGDICRKNLNFFTVKAGGSSSLQPSKLYRFPELSGSLYI